MLGKLLRQLNVELDRFNVLFDEFHALYHTDLNALVTILDAANRQEPITPGRLAAALDPSVSATTAPLERSGITRSSHPRAQRDRPAQGRTGHPRHRPQVGGDFYRPLMRELSGV
ncbi:hypothetical protein [Actinopolyspora halophila]|uniref:hypothetical protein n=1 Tax=Actinopolyspora halophila TaxID=1850 RepID=UPI0003AA34AC|nr:hypothetical protein [Actinopolyspora halophila]